MRRSSERLSWSLQAWLRQIAAASKAIVGIAGVSATCGRLAVRVPWNSGTTGLTLGSEDLLFEVHQVVEVAGLEVLDDVSGHGRWTPREM